MGYKYAVRFADLTGSGCLQIRARYLDGNTPIGDWSDVVTVQTIP